MGRGQPIDVEMFNYDGECVLFKGKCKFSGAHVKCLCDEILLISAWRFYFAACSSVVSQRCRERAEESGKSLFLHGDGAGAEETGVC